MEKKRKKKKKKKKRGKTFHKEIICSQAYIFMSFWAIFIADMITLLETAFHWYFDADIFFRFSSFSFIFIAGLMLRRRRGAFRRGRIFILSLESLFSLQPQSPLLQPREPLYSFQHGCFEFLRAFLFHFFRGCSLKLTLQLSTEGVCELPTILHTAATQAISLSMTISRCRAFIYASFRISHAIAPASVSEEGKKREWEE